MYINLTETIITSVNHWIEARASISTNELDPLLLFEARRVFEPGFYCYIHSPHQTDDNIMYQPSIRENTNVEIYIKVNRPLSFQVTTYVVLSALLVNSTGRPNVAKNPQTLIRRFFVRIFISKLNCCKFEPSYFCLLPVSSDDGLG